MKTEYKHIHFVNKKKLWICRNNKTDSDLGCIWFYETWKRYTIIFDEKAIFDAGCLRDISDFLDQLNKNNNSLANFESLESA